MAQSNKSGNQIEINMIRTIVFVSMLLGGLYFVQKTSKLTESYKQMIHNQDSLRDEILILKSQVEELNGENSLLIDRSQNAEKESREKDVVIAALQKRPVIHDTVKCDTFNPKKYEDMIAMLKKNVFLYAHAKDSIQNEDFDLKKESDICARLLANQKSENYALQQKKHKSGVLNWCLGAVAAITTTFFIIK